MSQGEYTISAVSEHTVDDGDYRIYYVRLNETRPKEGVQAFELVQKQASKAPKAGQTILVKTFVEGTRDGKPTVKIVKDWDAIKANQASGGNQSRGRDDATGQSIERQVAAKVAGEMVAGMPLPETGAIGVVANFEGFFDAVIAKIQGAPPQQTLNGGGGEVPADTTGMQPAAAPADDGEDIPF